MMRIRQVSLFEGLRGRRLVLTTNCAKGAQEERRRALQSICRAWTRRCSRARQTNARNALQCVERSTPLLQSALETTRLQCRIEVRTRQCERCSDGAWLRARLALIFGKAKRCRCECLSGGATHLPPRAKHGAAGGVTSPNTPARSRRRHLSYLCV